MFLLIRKNNSIYMDRARKEASRRTENQDPGVDVGIYAETIFKVKQIFKYSLTPLFKVMPSMLFRLLSYIVIFGYISETYHGFALTIPLMSIGIVSGVSHLIGTSKLKIKWDESLLNSIVGMMIPLYVDIHTPVSTRRLYVIY